MYEIKSEENKKMDLREVTELGITQDLLDLVPTECKYCGSTLDVNEVLTRYMCLNPYCKGKLQSRLVVFASELGIGGLDTSAFIDLVECEEFRLVSDLFLETKLVQFIEFAKKEDKPLLLKGLNLLLVNLVDIRASLDFETYVRCLAIPYVEGIQLRYANSIEMYRTLESALTLKELSEGLGMSSKKVAQVMNVWLSLLGYRTEVEMFELLRKKK